jgi:hypothetical protein
LADLLKDKKITGVRQPEFYVLAICVQRETEKGTGTDWIPSFYPQPLGVRSQLQNAPVRSGGTECPQDNRSWAMKKACILTLGFLFFSILPCISAFAQITPPPPCCVWGPRKIIKLPTVQYNFVGSVRSVLDQGMTRRQFLDQLDNASSSNRTAVLPDQGIVPSDANGTVSAERNIYNQPPRSFNLAEEPPQSDGIYREGIENPN